MYVASHTSNTPARSSQLFGSALTLPHLSPRRRPPSPLWAANSVFNFANGNHAVVNSVSFDTPCMEIRSGRRAMEKRLFAAPSSAAGGAMTATLTSDATVWVSTHALGDGVEFEGAGD